MINSIVNVFREQARCHKAIKSFYYNRNYEIGSGNEKHPLLWLEDPISGHNRGNIFANTVNFSVLFIPSSEDAVLMLQNFAFSVGLNIIERIKQNKDSGVNILPNWSYLSLRDYYDNNACGCRFTLEFNQLNMQNRCLIDEQFSDDGFFEVDDSFGSDWSVSGNEVYKDKLPVFDLTISK